MLALTCALLAALGNVVGGAAVALGARRGLKVIDNLVGFGAGFMLSVTIVDVLPEAIERSPGTGGALALGGYLLVHLSQHTATQHFHFGEETHQVTRVAGVTALIGMLLHTFFDGVAIASGFGVNDQLGILLFLAVVLHKLPEGVTIASLQVAGGRTTGQALGSAALLGAMTLVGVVVHDQVQLLATHGLALSAGVTLYVAASNLVPEFQAKRGWRVTSVFLLGALTFFALRTFLRSAVL